MMYSKTFRDYNQPPKLLGEGIVHPTMKVVGLLTNFNPPIEYYIKHKKDYASLIYFTDGECSLPQKSPSGMVWIITSNGCHQEYPGKTVYIPQEQK